jgi:hypothetical protein
MIAFYTSGHGFGHASRDIAVMNAVTRQQPDVALVVRTAVPAWLFDASLQRQLDVQWLENDSGVEQRDSLNIDAEETITRALRFYQRFDERVAAEAAWLAAHEVSIVVADVPPLAVAAAARAGLPSVVLANFTWDWIYRGIPEFHRRAGTVLDIITTAYAQTTHALRLPLYGGFAPMLAVVRNIPLVARRSRVGRAAVRRALGLSSDRPIVLASFGGHRMQLPYEAAAAGGTMTLIQATGEPPQHGAANRSGFLKYISSQDLAERQLRYEDLVAAADVVVSKPGYGIVSECIANDTALLYTSRPGLVEYDVMVAEMPRLLRCRFIAPDDLLAGRWAEGVEGLLRQPPPATTPMTNGAEVAAEFILSAVS